LSLKAREIGAASRHGGESAHFVIALQVIHVADGDAHAVGIAAAPGVGLAILAHDESHADGENRYVFRVFHLFQNLIERELAEGIDPRGYENDILLSLDPVKP